MAKFKIIYKSFNLDPKALGGFGVVIVDEKGKKIGKDSGASNKAQATTENRLNLYALLIGLRMLPDGSEVTLISDNEYSIKGALNINKRNANLDILEKIDYEKKRMRNVDYTLLKDASTKEKDAVDYCEKLAIESLDKKKFFDLLEYYPKKCASTDEEANKLAEMEKKMEINKHLDIIQNEINEIKKMLL